MRYGASSLFGVLSAWTTLVTVSSVFITKPIHKNLDMLFSSIL